MTPILIPAKNIYRKHYEKLLDNVIQLVQVNAKNKKEQAYEETLYEDFAYEPILSTQITEQATKSSTSTGTVSRLFASIQAYRKSLQGTIQKDKNKSYISSASNIIVEVIAEIEKGTVTCTGTVNDDFININNDFVLNDDIVFVKEGSSLEAISVFPDFETATARIGGQEITANLSEDEKSNTILSKNYTDRFHINISFLCGIKKYNLSYTALANIFPSEFTMSGTYEFIIPKQIKFYIEGVLVKTEFVDATEMFGDTKSKQSYVVDGNELLTQDNYFTDYSQEVFETPLPERYNTILQEYKNGKKKLTLLCDINDYYYYDATKPNKKGSIAISKNYTRLTFQEYDEVIPMIKKSDGSFVPIDKNEDGTPMVFVVLQVRVFYDGVVWQELTLQQK